MCALSDKALGGIHKKQYSIQEQIKKQTKHLDKKSSDVLTRSRMPFISISS